MYLPGFSTTLLLTLALQAYAATSSDDKAKEKPLEPCTVASASGAFYDLRSLSILPATDKKKTTKGEKTDDWHAKGYDYHNSKANFTLNICAPLVEKQRDFEGIKESLWKNVSAYYELDRKRYSIGYATDEKVSIDQD
jgi:cation-dependent mannose-6-phosphate receptor